MKSGDIHKPNTQTSAKINLILERSKEKLPTKNQSKFKIAKKAKKKDDKQDQKEWLLKFFSGSSIEDIQQEAIYFIFTEVVIGELFRLILPHNKQPKVRAALVKRHGKMKLAVMAEYLSFKNLPPTRINPEEKSASSVKLRETELVGLGYLMPLLLWVKETDAKWHNFAWIDDVIISYDHDWCSITDTFAKQKDNLALSKISKESLYSLFNPTDYKAYNWFNAVALGQQKSTHENGQPSTTFKNHNPLYSNLNLNTLQHDKMYLAHCCYSSHAILLFTDEMIKNFVNIYLKMFQGISVKVTNLATLAATKMTNELIARREQWQQAMMNDSVFLEYLKTKEAQQDQTLIEKRVKEFIPYQKHHLPTVKLNRIAKQSSSSTESITSSTDTEPSITSTLSNTISP